LDGTGFEPPETLSSSLVEPVVSQRHDLAPGAADGSGALRATVRGGDSVGPWHWGVVGHENLSPVGAAIVVTYD
jgi:hypothetical protein